MENIQADSLSSSQDTKKLIRTMSIYTGASIMGPLVLIGGSGYFLDRLLDTKPIITIIAIFISFIVTNFLLFKKTMLLMRKMNEVAKKAQEDKIAQTEPK